MGMSNKMVLWLLLTTHGIHPAAREITEISDLHQGFTELYSSEMYANNLTTPLEMNNTIHHHTSATLAITRAMTKAAVSTDNNAPTGTINTAPTSRMRSSPIARSKTPCEVASFIWRGVLTGILAMCGFPVNVLSFMTFWMTPRFSATAFILLCLAVIDSGVLFVYSLLAVVPNFCFYLKSCSHFTRFAFMYATAYVWPVGTICHMAATGVVVLVTFHRYIAVCLPHLVPRFGSLKAAKIQVLTVIVFSVLFNLPRFFDDYAYVVEDGSHATLTYTAWGANKTYDAIYSVALYYVVLFLLPFAALIFMTYKLIRGLREAKLKREQMTRAKKDELDLTLTLVAVVIIFMVCHSSNPIRRTIKAALPLEQQVCGTVYWVVSDISTFLVCFNSAVNFVLYCVFGRRFRHVLRSMMCTLGNRIYPQGDVPLTRPTPPTFHTRVTPFEQPQDTA